MAQKAALVQHWVSVWGGRLANFEVYEWFTGTSGAGLSVSWLVYEGFAKSWMVVPGLR